MSGAGLGRPTILIVDDDDIFVELVTDELQPHFVVEWAGNGHTALAAVARQTPDAIFLDQGLPDARGVDLIDEFRKAGCDAPVVMFTASQDVRVAAAAMRAGAIDFIVKDSDRSFFEDLVPTATRAVDKWNSEKELEYLREQQDEHARRLARFNEELRSKNEQLRKAYAQIEASHRQLQKKNQRLSELYETAHRFVDNVSHEMRTPLTVIKEFLAIVLDGLAGEINPQQREYLTIALAKTNDLARMVDDMLDISKIEAGLLRVARSPCRFSDILESVRDVLEQKLRSCGAGLIVDEQPGLPPLYCDQEKAGRVLINLVVNATKFSEEGTDIRVWARCGAQPDEVLIGVTDRGRGIAEEHLKVIFERFNQVGGATRASTRGFGLGLNIVKELVNLNLGEVQVHSALGQGSTFSFSVPVFDPALLMTRYVGRRHTFDHHGSRLAMIRASAVGDVTGISEHIQGFVVHHLSAFDLTFERPECDDVIVVALTNDPEALAQRLLVKNREELRLSPGSTVDLRLDVVHVWDADRDLARLVEAFVSLLQKPSETAAHVPQDSAHC